MLKVQHYCKHCTTTFVVNLGEFLSGDFFIVCPICKWKHYRHFVAGTAVHCNIGERERDPVEIHSEK